MQSDAEQRILKDITKLANRMRAMRGAGTRYDAQAIRQLEEQSRAKWNELRALRAGPSNAEPPGRHRGARW